MSAAPCSLGSHPGNLLHSIVFSYHRAGTHTPYALYLSHHNTPRPTRCNPLVLHVWRCRFMSTLDTAEGVLGIGERGADRLEDDMDTAGRDSGGSEALAGEGGAGVGSGAADGRAFWDVEDGDEVRLGFALPLRRISAFHCVAFVRLCYVLSASPVDGGGFVNSVLGLSGRGCETRAMTPKGIFFLNDSSSWAACISPTQPYVLPLFQPVPFSSQRHRFFRSPARDLRLFYFRDSTIPTC